MLAHMSFWWEALLPKRGPFFGVGMWLLLHPQGQAPLVELLDDLFQRLLAEVGDDQEVVFGPLHELANRVDLRPVEAVPRPFRQVELLDGQVEVEGGRGAGGGIEIRRAHV